MTSGQLISGQTALHGKIATRTTDKTAQTNIGSFRRSSYESICYGTGSFTICYNHFTTIADDAATRAF